MIRNFLKKRKRIKLINENLKHYLYDMSNLESPYIIKFLENAKKSFICGLFDASIFYSSQAVEIALLIAITRRYIEENRLEEFKGRYKPTFGALIGKIEHELKSKDVWVLDGNGLEKARYLLKLRNSYVHYINQYLLTYRLEEIDKQMFEEVMKEILTNSIIDDSQIKSFDFYENIALNLFNLKHRLKIQKIFNKRIIEPIVWLENKKLTEFMGDRWKKFIINEIKPKYPLNSRISILKWLIMTSAKFKIYFNLNQEFYNQKDALESIVLSYEILEYLGYIKRTK